MSYNQTRGQGRKFGPKFRFNQMYNQPQGDFNQFKQQQMRFNQVPNYGYHNGSGSNFKKMNDRIPKELYDKLLTYSNMKVDGSEKDLKYPNYKTSFQYIIKNLKKQNIKSIDNLKDILDNDENDRDLDAICNNSSLERILVRNEFKKVLTAIISE
jgi:hypothetical protein